MGPGLVALRNMVQVHFEVSSAGDIPRIQAYWIQMKVIEQKVEILIYTFFVHRTAVKILSALVDDIVKILFFHHANLFFENLLLL